MNSGAFCVERAALKTNRRQFLAQTAAATSLLAAGCSTLREPKSKAQVMTVRGFIPARDMGITLPHEHVMLDFIGAEKAERSRYKRAEVFEAVLPYLENFRDYGGQTLVECTPAYIGRDVELLRRLSEATRLNLITNTGYYGAAGNKFLPRHAFRETADELAFHWLADWTGGIEETDIRPGFIKIGVDAGPLSDIHRKLVRAAARTQQRSGLVIAAHTGDGVAAMDELAVLAEEGIAQSAFIWVHAQNEKNTDLHLRAAEQGAWVEFDHVSPQTIDQHVKLVQRMKEHQLLHRVLISHDGGWYEVGQVDGGQFRAYDTVFTEFIPALKEAEFTDAEIEQLMVLNPRAAFSIREV